jgi:hypothetical protein
VSRGGLRAGISLLEVLISIGVLAVGLMGVAALIPAAGYQAKEGARNERLANVGKRVFREMDVRGLLDFDENGNSRSLMFQYGPEGMLSQPPFARLWSRRAPSSNQSSLDSATFGSSFCVDPLGTSPNTSVNIFGTPPDFREIGRSLPLGSPEAGLPAFVNGPGLRIAFPNAIAPAGMTTIKRVCLDVDPTSPIGVPSSDRIAAELAFTGDILDFSVPKKKANAPQQNYLNSIDATTSLKIAARRNNETNLSWMIFCRPNTLSPRNGILPSSFHVSVAVFENRTTYDREYAGTVLSSDMTDGGRNVVVRFPFASPVAVNDYKTKFSKSLKRNAWIGLGWVHPTTGNMFYEWYSIMSVAEVDPVPPDPSSLVRQLQLKGSDWPFPVGGTIYAVHVPKMAAVYTKIMPIKVR